jgi:protein ImuB
MESFAPPPLARSKGAAVAPSPRVGLRAFRPPRPAQVQLQGGMPVHVSANGAYGKVVESAGPWRTSGDWWDVAWSREEWDVVLAGNAGLFRIYKDRLRDSWFVFGEVD